MCWQAFSGNILGRRQPASDPKKNLARPQQVPIDAHNIYIRPPPSLPLCLPPIQWFKILLQTVLTLRESSLVALEMVTMATIPRDPMATNSTTLNSFIANDSPFPCTTVGRKEGEGKGGEGIISFCFSRYYGGVVGCACVGGGLCRLAPRVYFACRMEALLLLLQYRCRKKALEQPTFVALE